MSEAYRVRKPTIETRPSHGGIDRGTPEYDAAIMRTRQRLGFSCEHLSKHRTAEPVSDDTRRSILSHRSRGLRNETIASMLQISVSTVRKTLEDARHPGPMREVVCRVCGTKFSTESTRAMYCGEPCQTAAAREQRRNNRQAARERRTA